MSGRRLQQQQQQQPNSLSKSRQDILARGHSGKTDRVNRYEDLRRGRHAITTAGLQQQQQQQQLTVTATTPPTLHSPIATSPTDSLHSYQHHHPLNTAMIEEPGANDNVKIRAMYDALREVEEEWRFMIEDDFDSVSAAMKLMDQSSLGINYAAFQAIYHKIEKLLQDVVDDYYQVFAGSVGSYRPLLKSIATSQMHVRSVKQALIDAKQNFTAENADLAHATERDAQYRLILDYLQDIEKIKRTPELLDLKISRKHFQSAVETFLDANALFARPEFKDVGALKDIRMYMKNQQSSIFEFLQEELHTHLYLKSAYTDILWKPYQPGQANIDIPESLTRDIKGLMETAQIPEVGNKVPESDTLTYIASIFISFQRLGRLRQALSHIVPRITLEIYQVMEKTVAEVKNRHKVDIASSVATQKLALIADRSLDNEVHSEALRDLFWTLYSKFTIIIVLFRRINGITEYLQAGTMDFNEVLGIIQTETKTILSDYLLGGTDETDLAGSMNNLFMTKHRPRRAIFKLSAVSSVGDWKRDEDELQAILKDVMPGIASQRLDAKRENVPAPELKAERQLIVPSNPLNIKIIFDPTMTFLSKVIQFAPSAIPPKAIYSFIDDFLENSLAPRLGDFTNRISQLIEAMDATDFTLSEDGGLPILKNVPSIMTEIQNFCAIFISMQFQWSHYTTLVLRILTQFQNRCNEIFKELMQVEDVKVDDKVNLKPAATWASDNEMREVLVELREHNSKELTDDELLIREMQRYLILKDKTQLRSSNLTVIASIASVARLGNTAVC